MALQIEFHVGPWPPWMFREVGVAPLRAVASGLLS